MFEQALIYRAGVDKLADIGVLAETLFFYGSTQLVLDRASVIALAQKIPQDILLELFDREAVKASYLRDNFGILSAGVLREHNFAAFKLAKQVEGKKKISSHQDEIEEALKRELGDTREVRKLAQKLGDRISLQRFRGVPQKQEIVPILAREDVVDADFVENAVRECLIHWIPGFDPMTTFQFGVFKTATGSYAIDTNLDFDALNAEYHKHTPASHSSISSAYLLSQILSARTDIFFAAYYMAEPVTNDLHGSIARLKHFEFLRRRDTNAEDVELFHEVIVPEIPRIRDVINSGERSMKEFLGFLDEAAKFKKMLREASPDVGLIQSYNKEVTKKSWVETLPGKTVRFFVASGLGLGAHVLVPGAGLGVSGANSFLADRLLKGWRPRVWTHNLIQ